METLAHDLDVVWMALAAGRDAGYSVATQAVGVIAIIAFVGAGIPCPGCSTVWSLP